MYFWNINGLKEEIVNGTLTEKSYFYYIFAYIVLVEIWIQLSYYTFLFNEEVLRYGFIEYIISATYILITIIGLIYCFISNGGKNGKQFANKFFSLSWVISIRYIVFLALGTLIVSIILVITMILVNSIFDPNYSEENEPIFLEILFTIIMATWLLFLYYRIGHHIKDTNRRIKESTFT